MTTTDLPAPTGSATEATGTAAGSLIPTLGGEYYCNDGVFGLEQEHILEKMWFCAVRSA
ncbi:MAG: glycine betaine catabolism, partial [Mycobacterium sp.]|nr:glycine betaine catabolism [Mycobacterium sp.]